MAPRRVVSAMWSSLYEPRAVTIVTVTAYAVAAAGGIAAAVSPTPLGDGALALRWICAVFLIGGGVVGVPAAWRGWWWIERVCTLAVAAGVALAGILIVSSHLWVIRASLPWAGAGTVWLSVIGPALGVLAMLARFLRVRRAPYAPGHGPLSTTQQIAIVKAALHEDTGRQRRISDDDQE